MRKLASIRKIGAVNHIDGADTICSYSIDGWNVIDKIGKYNTGDLVVYFEPDTWMPKLIANFLCNPDKPKFYDGVEGERLRTKKLKGVISQGLIMPLSDFNLGEMVNEYDDVTNVIGVKKWEPPLDKSLQGKVEGSFPAFIPKTDSERIQNLSKSLQSWIDNKLEWECTMKLHGSSMTVYKYNDELGVCSRNLSLKIEGDNLINNAFVSTAVNSQLLQKLQEMNCNYAIQGELMGPKICDNLEKFDKYQYFVYDIFNIDTQQYLSPKERYNVFNKLQSLGADIKHVPIIIEHTNLVEHGIDSIKSLLDFAEGESITNSLRERISI